jgi:hypothetical protein
MNLLPFTFAAAIANAGPGISRASMAGGPGS